MSQRILFLFFVLIMVNGETMAQRTEAENRILNIGSLLNDIRIVEREEAEAKRIRLEWISEERNRIHLEMKDYASELEMLRELVPDPRKPRELARAQLKQRERQKLQFNDWATTTLIDRKHSIIRGESLNALLKILGPIAHYRQQREVESTPEFPSLRTSEKLDLAVVSHLNFMPATLSGSRLIIRLNRDPLEIVWPTILPQHFLHDCEAIEKLRDQYSQLLTTGDVKDVKTRAELWQLLDEALALLQAKAIKKQKAALVDDSIEVGQRTKKYLDFRNGIRYIESLRASAERYKDVPQDFSVRTFHEGSIEDFLVFCYTNSMVMNPANPGDEEAYLQVFRKMQDYARDVQYVEDWKQDLELRIGELSVEDRFLIWEAASQ